MSLVTAVMVGNDESECVKLGSDAMLDEDLTEEFVEDIMSECMEALELEWEEKVLCGIG